MNEFALGFALTLPSVKQTEQGKETILCVSGSQSGLLIGSISRTLKTKTKKNQYLGWVLPLQILIPLR